MKIVVLALTLVAALAIGIASRADDYPSKPVRILVGFAPGGGSRGHRSAACEAVPGRGRDRAQRPV